MQLDTTSRMFGSRELLQDRLIRNFAGKDAASGASAALWVDGSFITVEHALQAGSFTSKSPVPVGCVTKSMTATLVTMALADFNLTLDQRLVDILPRGHFPALHSFDTLTLKHLLSHSHGLDEAHLRAVPRLDHKWIDTRTLLSALGQHAPMAEPGEHFSYGNASYWLLAGVLEHLYRQDYTSLLNERLLQPLGIEVPRAAAAEHPVCPALSDGLTLSAEDLCRFVTLHLPGATATPPIAGLEQLLAHQSPILGWSAKEKTAHCGWRGYGQDWYGHNGRVAGFMVMLRFNPRRNIALVVTGTDQRSSDTAYRGLFADLLPEFSDAEILPPSLLSAERWAQSDRSLFCGSYRNSRWHLRVDYSDAKHLRLRAHDRAQPYDPEAPTLKRFLKPAEQQVFFAMPSDPLHFPFLQFVRRPGRHDGPFDYVWNGSALWKRVGSDD